MSVVVPTHARPQALSALLKSLDRQRYPLALIELTVVAIVGDPAFEVVEAWRVLGRIDAKCVHLPDDEWQGRNVSAKRNYGVERSRGEWIAFIDDDCVADPGWIESASELFGRSDIWALEGRTEIPFMDPPTLTWKGLQSLARPGGYQTCNLFVRRERFQQVGGFDLRFPFYLEDTDMAWTLLEAGSKIPFASGARVTHPVPRPAPWRLLDDAKRASLLPYLYKKHPALYAGSRVRALQRFHWMYLVAYVLWLAGMATGGLSVAIGLASIAAMTALHCLKLFWRCRVEVSEVMVTAILLPVVSVVRLVQLIRGNLRNRVWLWS